MKRSYKLGAHTTTLITKPKLEGPLACGIAHWEEKIVEMRTTNAGNGTPYDLPSFLVVFFHEYFHMIDTMQGTELFTDRDLELDYKKETILDSFCEGFVQFMLDNQMLKPEWLKGCTDLLKKTKGITIEERDD
jgi:hypothetical protein